MTLPYTPRPGSIAEQVMLLLQARGSMSEDQLAAECDVSIDVLTSSTTMAVRMGAIRCRMAAGTRTWRLCAGICEPDDVEEQDDLVPIQRTVPASEAEPLQITVQPWPPAIPLTSESPPCAGQSRPSRAGEKPEVEAALERSIQDQLLAPLPPLVTRTVPCIPQVTVSFSVTPHQAERLCAFAASMTEVQS